MYEIMRWKSKWNKSSTPQILKRDRFSLILKFLHLNDNTEYIAKGQPGHDPLFKLRPFVDSLLHNFQRAYTLGREVSVDQQIISFKVRLSFLQYMPKKPVKWGMKAFVLADSTTGYIYNWRLYTGIKKIDKPIMPQYYTMHIYIHVHVHVYFSIYHRKG